MNQLDLEQFSEATKGPWKVRVVDEALCVYGENGRPVSLVREYNGVTEEDADNAILIAAAPQLLAEVRALRKWRLTINQGVEDGLYEHDRNIGYDSVLAAWRDAEKELNNDQRSL